MQRMIEIYGEIGTDCTVVSVLSDITKARDEGATAFSFHIDSVGGSVDEGFAIANMIEGLKEETTSIALNVFSIANVIYFACNNRESETYSTFMLHNAWAEVEGNASELRMYADMLENASNRIASYIASKTNKGVSEITALMSKDRYINEDEAKQLGFYGKAQKTFKLVARHAIENEKTFSDYPKAARANAQRALDYREKTGNPNGCMTAVGWNRANQIAKGEPLSYTTIKRTANFLNRFSQYANDPIDKGCGRLAHLGWGGSEMLTYCEKIVKQEENKNMSKNKLEQLFSDLRTLFKNESTVESDNPGTGESELRRIEDGVYSLAGGDEMTITQGKTEMQDGVYEMQDGRKVIVKDSIVSLYEEEKAMEEDEEKAMEEMEKEAREMKDYAAKTVNALRKTKQELIDSAKANAELLEANAKLLEANSKLIPELEAIKAKEEEQAQRIAKLTSLSSTAKASVPGIADKRAVQDATAKVMTPEQAEALEAYNEKRERTKNRK